MTCKILENIIAYFYRLSVFANGIIFITRFPPVDFFSWYKLVEHIPQENTLLYCINRIILIAFIQYYCNFKFNFKLLI